MSEIDTSPSELVDAIASAVDPANFWMRPEHYGGGSDAETVAQAVNGIARKKARAALAAITAAGYEVRPALAAYKEASAPSGDGWIKWEGGERPVEAHVDVDVRYHDGICEWENPAGEYDWTHRGMPGDIVAYRVVEDA